MQFRRYGAHFGALLFILSTCTHTDYHTGTSQNWFDDNNDDDDDDDGYKKIVTMTMMMIKMKIMPLT